jgi:hypothetical protein
MDIVAVLCPAMDAAIARASSLTPDGDEVSMAKAPSGVGGNRKMTIRSRSRI